MKKTISRKIVFLAAAIVALSSLLVPGAALAQAPPAPPSGLYCIPGSGQVEVHWTDNSDNETGFVVERAPDVGGLGPGTYARVGPNPTVGANVTAYIDTTVQPVKAYWYRAAAVNGSVSSFYSNETRVLTSVAAPLIALSEPANRVLLSGAANSISANATVSGTTVVSSEYQFIASNAPGVFDARDIYATQMDLESLLTLGPRAGSPVSDNTAMPADLPAGCIAEFEIRGTISSTPTDINNGIWRVGAAVGASIGTPPAANTVPPFVVYESVANPATGTKFVGYRHPAANDAVKIIAYRNAAANGPLVAKEITFIAPAQPAGAPALSLGFLFNGPVTVMTPAVTAPGYLISGETWTVGAGAGAGHFRIDAPYFPAYVDPNVGMGTNVTVRFGTMPAEANIARQIYAPNLAAVLTTTDVNPVFDTTSVVVRKDGTNTLNVPDGTWLFFVVDGVVSDVDLVKGGWTVGVEQIKTYQTSQSLISPASVGDEVLFFCVRTLTPGPLTLESTYQILPGPLVQPYKPTAVEVHPMYNGNIVSMSPNTWTIAGPAGAPVTFIVDDPEGKARIDPLPFPSFSVGMPVTVEFEHVGEELPDDANWAPMTQTPGSDTWTADMALPGVSANQTGTLFLRTTDATQQGSTTAAAVTLAMAGSLSASTIAANSVASTSAVLNGNLASMGTDTSASVAFQWGTTSGSLTNTTPAQTVAAPGPFSATVSGLSPVTTYYFRSTATTAAGTAYGAEMSFTTAAAPPPTTTAPPPPVFFGGGGGGAPATTTVALSGLTGSLTLNSSGAVQTTATITGSGVTLSIPAGTIMKTSAGSPLSTFTMSDATNVPAPPSGKVIVLAKDFGPGGATFDPPIGLTLNYNQAAVPSGVQESGFVIAYWDGTQWVTLSTSVNADANTVSASISHLTIFAVLGTLPTPTPAAPAKFAMTRLAVNPVECKPADTVTVAATVANTGGAEGQYDLALLINGAKQESKTVTLSSGSSMDVTFTTKAGIGPRIYVVDVNGMQGTFVVQAPETTPTAPSTTTAAAPPAQPSSTNPWIVGGLIAIGAVVVVMLIVLMAGRRKK